MFVKNLLKRETISGVVFSTFIQIYQEAKQIKGNIYSSHNFQNFFASFNKNLHSKLASQGLETLRIIYNI